MKRKPIAIAFSDLHTAKWKQYNEEGQRTNQPLNILNIIEQKCIDLKINTLLFAGDWNDHPKHVDNDVLDIWGRIGIHLGVSNIGVIGIDGNHDFSKVSSINKHIKGFFTHLAFLNPNFICVNFNHYDTPFARVHGIPYINGNADYYKALKVAINNRTKDKKNILLIHRDLPGAMEPNGREIGENKDDKKLKKLLGKFDLVLSGHIHKPQAIKKMGKHVFMLGATNQQRRSDMGTKMGYWIVYNDMSVEFKDLKQPEFRYYHQGETPSNETDYWIKLPSDRNLEVGNNSTSEFKSNQKRDILVKNYLKVRGIKSKRKFNLLMDLINE